MKPRRIMAILIVNYLLIVFVSVFGEFLFIGTTSKNTQLLIRTAADMALEQVQASDDFFKPGEGYMLDSTGVKTDAFKVAVPTTAGEYEQVGVYQVLTEKQDKGEIFESMYGGGKIDRFLSQVPQVLDIETNLGYWKEGFPSVQWYAVPKIGIMGLDVTGSKPVKAYKGPSQAPVDEVQGIWKTYEFEKAEKIAYLEGGQVESYYMTPISLGITYINEEMLQYFFMNNLDLLMRVKYAKNGWNLSSPEGGDGILRGETFKEFVASDLDSYNPINNGEFTLLRGERVIKDNGYEFYKGMKPTIRYKVIDMYAKENEDILKSLYGYESSKRLNGSKADYLKAQDNEPNPATGTTPDHKPIVVAEVTFYADVVVPYKMLALREMRATSDASGRLEMRQLFNLSDVGPQSRNYIDIVRKDEKGSGVQSEMGNNSDVIMYKRLFAITP